MSKRICRLIVLLVCTGLVVATTACDDYGWGGWGASGYTLMPVRDCRDARDYIAAMATESLLEGGYFGDERGLQGSVDTSFNESAPPDSPTDYTTTNVQEVGVDEADIVETDGDHVYMVSGEDLIIARSWPPEDTAEVGRVFLGGQAHSMFLYNDRVVVFSQSDSDLFRDDYNWRGGTRVTLVDVSNRAAPRVLRRVDAEGWMVDARAIEGNVYLVLQSYLNFYREDFWRLTEGIDTNWWNHSDPERARYEARFNLYPRVRAYIDRIPLSELLPEKSEGGRKTMLMECGNLYRPSRVVRPGIVTVVSFDMKNQNRPVNATGVLGGHMEVYSSKDNLYLAQSSWAWTWSERQKVETHVHKMSLDPAGGAPVYQASGSVSGWLLNQFSMSEHEGYIRLATTDATWWNDEDGNNVWVLEQRDDQLAMIGQLRGLSPGEQIYAARFLGNRAYLVTFRQIDPLHTIDLSNPRWPRELGQLEVPGFSTYLHPIDEGYLLAIGNDGDFNVQLSLFDVRNPSFPVRIFEHSISVGNWRSHSEAMYDHHAFTYHPERRILAIPVNDYSSGSYFTGAKVFRVTIEDGFEQLGGVDHSDIARAAGCPDWYSGNRSSCYDEYRWWVQMRRSIFIEDYLYTISSVGMSVDELVNPSNHLSSLVF